MSTPSQPEPKPAPLTAAERKEAERQAEAEAEAEQREDRLFEALYHGTVDGEAFDGDPADLW